jgi:hypothetical protein
MKNMKLIGLMIITIFSMAAFDASACEIEFKVVGEEKKVYQAGDEIVVEVEVHYTHRRCPESIKATKFTYDGFEVLGATKWTEVKFNVWKRKVKLKVVGTKNGKLLLSAERTCNKEGGSGSISFKSTPLKE